MYEWLLIDILNESGYLVWRDLINQLNTEYQERYSLNDKSNLVCNRCKMVVAHYQRSKGDNMFIMCGDRVDDICQYKRDNMTAIQTYRNIPRLSLTRRYMRKEMIEKMGLALNKATIGKLPKNY